jgi:hypothetical protein
MKYTLLELTQSILSSMDSDEINSIDDSVESLQVVEVIKTVYNDIIARSDITKHKVPFTLDASGDITKPVLMTKPAEIDRIDYIQYNKVEDGDTDPLWTDLKYLPFQDFMEFTHGYTPSESDVDTMSITSNGFTFVFNYKNDVGPQYFTTFNDDSVIFDAIDLAVDSTLQSNKTLCYGTRKSDFVAINSFTPNLQPNQFPLLLNEAKSLAWAELKQMPHSKAEQSARRNWRHIQKTRNNILDGDFGSGTHPFDKLPNFARR